MTLSNALILIDEIRKQKYKLNEWENGFIQSIEMQKWNLTYKQGKALETIYEKANSGGIYQQKQRI